MSLPKWNDERTAQLEELVGTETPVTQATVASVAESLDTSARSVSSKLRKLGFEVELASAKQARAYSEEQEATLRAFVESNSGAYTYAEIAEAFEGGAFSAKSVQGKILSMELTDHVKATPKPEAVRTYSPEEEKAFIDLVQRGGFVEDIAEALGRPMNSIRGKALSLLRSGDIAAIPKQKHTKGSEKSDPLEAITNLAEMNVADIAELIGKTVRGVRTMLTRRGLVAADYDGAAKKAKSEEG